LAECKPFADVTDGELKGDAFNLTFDVVPDPADEQRLQYVINGRTMGAGDPLRIVRLNTAEEWTLSAADSKHPFHIHVNPFEVITRDASGKIVDRIWRDTLFVTPDEKQTIRMRFSDFTGRSVLHCHNLHHSENGMMRAFLIEGGASQATDSRRAHQAPGLSGLPCRAPAWELGDAEGRRHSLAEFAGKDLALFFIRSLGCLHCSRQIQALAARHLLFEEAGMTVVLVSADEPEALRGVKVEDSDGRALPFLILSDATGAVFRDYGCGDGQDPQHGTFLIDRKGEVRWQNVGPEPYMEIDRLVELSR
jgi:peroxiredoxin